MDKIHLVDPLEIDFKYYKKQLADCVILTYDKKLFLQRRPNNWGQHAGTVNIFGGHIEKDESAQAAVIREIAEETGGIINSDDLFFIGAITEDWTNHEEIVHVYFWQDKKNTITGCYEAESIIFETLEEALHHPKIMEYARWALMECRNKGYI